MNTRWSSLDHFHDLGLLVLRAGVGSVFLFIHGFPKLAEPGSWAGVGRAVGYLGIKFGHQAWGLAAILAMTLGAVCLILGWAHRPAALALTITMAVASIWKFYPFGGWSAAAYPFAMMLVCAGLLLTGPGRYAISGK